MHAQSIFGQCSSPILCNRGSFYYVEARWEITFPLDFPAISFAKASIVRIGVRISGLAILTTKYTLLTSIPRHMYNSLTLKVFCTAFDANTSLYDSDTCSTVQKQLLHSLNLPRKRARRARSARLV